jgi:hypothetical protein
MRTIGACVLVLALVGGCATTAAQPWSFEKSGMSEAELRRDQRDCFASAVDAADTDWAGWVKFDRVAYRACMEQRGYAVRVSGR